MTKVVGLFLLIIGSAAAVYARIGAEAPEIDPGSAVSALALISGAALVIRGRRK
jgi:hypothetical protein